MSGTAQILREYLVSLGFKVDAPGEKKFDTGLNKLSISAMGLTKTLIGAATAAQTMVGLFASQMEKLYYSSQKADSTIAGMKAMEFAAKQVGVSGDTMRGALEGMGRAMRANPGLEGLLHSLNVPTEGRTGTDKFMDLLHELHKMPFAVGKQYAQLFGIDEDTYFLLNKNLPKMEEALKLRRQIAAESGVDLDKESDAAVKYAQSLSEVAARVEVLYQKVSTMLLPSFQRFTDALNGNLSTLSQWLAKAKTIDDVWEKLVQPKKAEPGGEHRHAKNFIDFLLKPIYTGPAAAGSGGAAGPEQASGPASQPAPSKEKSRDERLNQLASLENKYALPPGLLSALWAQEASYQEHPKNSPAGAEGPFQFMPKTAQEYHINPQMFEQAAEAAAKKMQGLLSYYGGNKLLAITAWNSGEGVLDSALRGERSLKPESQNFGPGVLGKMALNQTNNITVSGVSDPHEAGREVAEAVTGATRDVVRNNQGRMQ